MYKKVDDLKFLQNVLFKSLKCKETYESLSLSALKWHLILLILYYLQVVFLNILVRSDIHYK